jgi:outer membrane protein OmpA-like peptidoglycan-associated protein
LAHKVKSEATVVAQQFAPTMAAQPAGARIILYFNNRAQPVRDVTDAITNLVAEVKDRPTYTLEVIGHTDQTGAEAVNLRIGRERAQAIADRLIAAGVPKDRVKVTSKGSAEPAVNVKNRNTVELRNRRVEVFVR